MRGTWNVNDPDARVKNAVVNASIVAGGATFGLLVIYTDTPAWLAALIALGMLAVVQAAGVFTDGPDRGGGS